AFGMLTVWLEVHHVGALGDEWSLTFVERTLLAGKIVCFYIWKLLWPSNLAFIYERWNASFHSAWQLAFPAGVTAVLLTLLGLRNRLGRGPLVAVLFFIGTLFPALGFFDVYPMRYSFVADHFQYLASIGIIALVIGGAARLLSQAPRRLRSSGVVLAVVLLLNLALLTWRQISIYEGLETLWLDTLSKNPTCWMAHVNLGVYYQSNGRPDDAARNFESALEIQPAHAKAANNLGCVLATQSNFDGAILSFRNALALDPEFTLAHYNLADALASIGDFRGSQQHYLQAAELDPSFASAHFKLGLIAYQEGRFNEAAARFRRTLELEPTHPRAADYLVRSAPH
ncbi:MAG: tetratricopeptide repeat protein, partial [bacterium]|nr:tetratricopeptide repeat protein [bacterium]